MTTALGALPANAPVPALGLDVNVQSRARQLLIGTARIDGGTVIGTRLVSRGPSSQFQMSVNNHNVLAVMMRIDPAIALPNYGTKTLRLTGRFHVFSNGTAPGVALTGGLGRPTITYPASTDAPYVSAITALTSSTLTVTAGAAVETSLSAYDTAVVDDYCLYVSNSLTTAAASCVVVLAYLDCWGI